MSENLKISKLMLLIVLIGIIVRIPFFNYTVDDTYLHFVFAKNIADGKGVSFFPGEPSAGTTSPFWIHLLAYTYLLTKDFYFTSKILEYSLSILSIILVYFLTFKLFKSKKLSILSSFFWAINPWYVLWSITGMETSLFTFLTFLGIYWAVENDYKKNLLASIFLGLATLTRPEGAFLFIIMLTSKFFLFLKKKYEMKIILLLALCFFAILAPWLVYSLLTFGSIVPNSFYSIRSFLKFSIQGTFGAGLSGALFVIGSFILQIPFLIIAFSKIVFKRENFHFIPIAWLIALLCFYTLSGLVFVRYFIPGFPLIIIYSLYGLGEVCEKFPIGKFLLIIFLSLFILRDSLLLSFAYSFSEKTPGGVDELLHFYFELVQGRNTKEFDHCCSRFWGSRIFF